MSVRPTTLEVNALELAERLASCPDGAPPEIRDLIDEACIAISELLVDVHTLRDAAFKTLKIVDYPPLKAAYEGTSI